MTPARLTEIPVVFYRTSGGAEPVLDWLRDLPTEDRRAIGTDLAPVQFGWAIGRRCVAHSAAASGGCSTLPSRRIARQRMKEMQA